MPSVENDDPLPPLAPALLGDDDDLVDAIARRIAAVAENLAETAVLESALDLVREQLDGDGRDALVLALALLDERRDALVLQLVRAAIIETTTVLRDADGVLQDEEKRAWWIDGVVREDAEVQRLSDRLRRREERLRQLVDDEAFRAYMRLEAASSERTCATHDALIAALIAGHPAPERGRR
jgi:hypothetical protein